MNALRTSAAALAVAAAFLAGGGMAAAEQIKMNTQLTGDAEVPPVTTSGDGEIQVLFDTDTRMLSWELEYEDISSAATAAHFHGPAEAGENAPPVVPVEDFSNGATGSAELTEDQAADLTAGKWYFNLHTTDHPDGEIRGQVKAAM